MFKELKFYPDGEHVCANYLDEVIPYTIDWFIKHVGRRNWMRKNSHFLNL
jgi:hypothetical protein